MFKLGIFLFPLLTNSYVFFWNMWFLLYDSNSMSLRRPPQMHQLHRTLPLLDHLFTFCLYLLYSMFWCLIFWDWMYCWWYIIHRHHFCLNLAFFYFLYSLTFMFSLKHVVSPIRLKLHVTKEVPLSPYFLIAFVTLRTMFSLVGGRVEEVSFVHNAKLFW